LEAAFRLMPVASLVTTISALGMIAPVASVMIPVICAFVLCACRPDAAAANKKASRKRRFAFMSRPTEPPPRLALVETADIYTSLPFLTQSGFVGWVCRANMRSSYPIADSHQNLIVFPKSTAVATGEAGCESLLRVI